MAEKKFLDLLGLQSYDTKSKAEMDKKDAETLKQSKEYSDGLAVNYDPAGTAQSKVDALEKGQVTINKNDIATLETSKADKATTLAGYGITDAFTKDETRLEITTAIANADHLKRVIVDQLPSVDTADEHTIYMIEKTNPLGENAYDEYMVVNNQGVKKLEKIGDSAVDLTDYAKKQEVATAKQEAITSATEAAALDATTKANKALSDAKEYTDSLTPNYATSAQGIKADTAVQKADVVTGTANGSISVQGTDVEVKGLASAAYADARSFDAAGTAQTKVNELASGQVTTNKNDIAGLKTKVDNLPTMTEISTEEINALFATSTV